MAKSRRLRRSASALALVLSLLAGACATAQDPHSVDSITTTRVPPPSQGSQATTTVTEAPPSSELVRVKYRSDPVDVASFQHLPGRGSLVRSAWYDEANRYLLIDLGGTTYHYCDVPNRQWLALASSDSMGSFYNQELKGSYDCRLGFVPSYDG